MLLLWIAIAVLIGVSENIKDSRDARKYKQQGGFYAQYPCYKKREFHSNNLNK